MLGLQVFSYRQRISEAIIFGLKSTSKSFWGITNFDKKYFDKKIIKSSSQTLSRITKFDIRIFESHFREQKFLMDKCKFSNSFDRQKIERLIKYKKRLVLKLYVSGPFGYRDENRITLAENDSL